MSEFIVSIIIPTFNRAESLRQTLSSFLNLNFDFHKIEFIIVDNNSTDTTPIVISDFASQNPNIIVNRLFEIRPGVHFARNSAAKIAKGNFLYFTDDDMIIDPNAITELLKLFQLDIKLATVTGLVLPIWEISPPNWILTYCNNYYLSLNDPPFDLLISNYDSGIYSCHQMIKRDVFFKAGGFNPENTAGVWIGDGETGLNNKVKILGFKFGFTSKAIIYHVIPESRMTQKYFNKRLKNQGYSDSYTDFKKNNPGRFRLIINSIFRLNSMLLRFIKFIILYFLFKNKWRVNLAFFHYHIARIKYDFKLMTNSSFRSLVLKNDWLDA